MAKPVAKRTFVFAHKTFPGQFGGIAQHLHSLGHEVCYITTDDRFVTAEARRKVRWCKIICVQPKEPDEEGIDTQVLNTLRAMALAKSYMRAAQQMKAKMGVEADLICAHSGWGAGSYLKAVWPDAVFVQYLEWWYRFPARDVPGSADVANPDERRAHALARNQPFMLDAQTSARILVPTEFQCAEFPDFLRARTTVLHDGVDTSFFSPAPPEKWTRARAGIPEDAPLITYATRGMEPTRGFPEFMGALSHVMQNHPKVHCAIAGNDSIHYGAKLPEGDSWKKRMLAKYDFDMERLHFTGRLPLSEYRDLLRASDIHVTLSQPFVLSWSVIQAMASGCALVVSDNDALREALPEAGMAAHVNHSDIPALARAIDALVRDPERRTALGKAARARAVERYGQDGILQKKTALFDELIAARDADLRRT